ncbi:Gtp-binding protein parf [Globisporangium polare]
MSLITVTSAVKAFSVCSTTLFVKFFATVSIQGGKSFAAGARSPEDNSFNKDGKLPQQNYGLANTESDGVSEELKKARAVDFRWKRIVQNDLETIPIGLAVFLGSMLVGGHETTNCALMGVFTGARIAHTFAYAYELQPHRALLWSTGQLCVLASGLNGVISFII